LVQLSILQSNGDITKQEHISIKALEMSADKPSITLTFEIINSSKAETKEQLKQLNSLAALKFMKPRLRKMNKDSISEWSK
jgi:hypothetical protein